MKSNARTNCRIEMTLMKLTPDSFRMSGFTAVRPEAGPSRGSRISSAQHFGQVIILPNGLQVFAPNAHFQGGFPLQQVVGDITQGGHILGCE